MAEGFEVMGFWKTLSESTTGSTVNLAMISREPTQRILTLTERSVQIPQRNKWQLRNKNITCVRAILIMVVLCEDPVP